MKRCRCLKVAGSALALGAVLLLGALAEAADVPRRTLELKVGGAEVLQMPYPVRRASIAAAEIADVVVLSPRELYVYGKKVGYTSVILWEEGNEGSNGGRTLLDVVVALDLTALKEKLHQLFPDEEIEVYASETGVVLAGTVSGPEVVEQVLRLTRTYLPQIAQEADKGKDGTGTSGSGITNLLRVGGIQQVMLEVKFAEVVRDSGKESQLGVGFRGLSGSVTGRVGPGNALDPVTVRGVPARLTDGTRGILQDFDTNALVQGSGSLLLNFAGNAANIFVNIGNFTAALQLLEREGLARTLAEPRLVTQSGQEASFLAGGEFPVPVAQDNNQITIEWKDFGVALRFTPIVLKDGKISLRVAPTVSDIASASTIPAGILGANFIVPNLSTRRLETTVQLYDGQTLALAGLLQDNLRQELRKVPGLGDIPILGSLFRSQSYRQEKTDLLIAVTPHIVKPNREGALRFPGENLRPPDWFEFYLEGRLEGERSAEPVSGLSSHRFQQVPQTKAGGLEGDFGHRQPQ
ncbi:MAG: type II and III secretion system protein family protein [Deferrisomatales bacterium]|nr:type II and III secretion system protein family protein [Deferrisomatales bacterium]